MGLRINTNVLSLAAQRSLNINRGNQERSLERLSSGNRINRSGDDAAGLAISENLKAGVRSLKQAVRNGNDGVSLVQVAEGAMNEVSSILVRLRELSIQAASDTVGDVERQFIHKEVAALKEEINRIGVTTEFNGHKLLSGTVPDLDFQIGVHNNPTEDRLTFASATLATNLESLGVESLSTESKAQAQENLSMLDNAIVKINDKRASLGALQNRLTSTINNIMIYRENLEAANSRIRDTDMAEEVSELTKTSILTQATISTLAQANSIPQSVLKLMG